jgi:hypothetical protein
MSNKNNQKSITAEEMREIVREEVRTIVREEIANDMKEFILVNKFQNEEIMIKIETILLPIVRDGLSAKNNKKAPKTLKGANKTSEVQKTKIKKKFTNTLYWWKDMYENGDILIADSYTNEEEEKAKKEIDSVTDKPANFNYRSAVGLSIWKAFTPTKRSGELKTMFTNWKIEKEKIEAQDMEKEPNTDDELNEKNKELKKPADGEKYII